MAEQTFNAKLLAAMQEMSNPKKDTNAYKYKYAQLDQVLGIVRPALQAHGMDIRWQQRKEIFTFINHNGESQDRTIYVQELYVFDANEERLMDTRPIDVTASIQDRGSEETYLRRYALQSVFALAAEDDDGAEIDAKQKAKKSQQSAKKAPNKPQKKNNEEDIEKRIENGIKALSQISALAEEDIYKILRKIETPQGRLDWLEKTYRENNEPVE